MVVVGGICHKCNRYYVGDHCQSCDRTVVNIAPNFIADFHDSYFDNGLGTVVKSRQHRKQLMKEKGVVEVGNEKNYILGNQSADHKREVGREKRFNQLQEEAHLMWRD